MESVKVEGVLAEGEEGDSHILEGKDPKQREEEVEGISGVTRNKKVDSEGEDVEKGEGERGEEVVNVALNIDVEIFAIQG